MRDDLIYVYDGSFEGLLSAVHTAYYSREDPVQMMGVGDCQQTLFCEVKQIETDRKKYKAVYSAISKKISPNALFNVQRVYLSDDAARGTMIFNYLKLGFHMGARVDIICAKRVGRARPAYARRVSNEAGWMREFIRFSEMENGIRFLKSSRTTMCGAGVPALCRPSLVDSVGYL